jgi:hypothetical protein
MKKEYISEMDWSKFFSFLNSKKKIYTKAEKKCKKLYRGNFLDSKNWRSMKRASRKI